MRLFNIYFSCAAKTDPDFKAFLDERNPKQQHSSTLESYLIKPIQRVLKYPLLLKELYSLTDPDSEEHYHLDGESEVYSTHEHIVLMALFSKKRTIPPTATTTACRIG